MATADRTRSPEAIVLSIANALRARQEKAWDMFQTYSTCEKEHGYHDFDYPVTSCSGVPYCYTCTEIQDCFWCKSDRNQRTRLEDIAILASQDWSDILWLIADKKIDLDPDSGIGIVLNHYQYIHQKEEEIINLREGKQNDTINSRY